MSGRPLRITHVTATFPPYRGGAGTAAWHLAEEQARRGHDVRVVTAAAPGTPPAGERARVERLRPPFAIGNAPLLPPLARLRGAQVVHLQYPFIFGAELLLAGRARSRAALVLSFQNELVGGGPRGAAFRVYEATWGRAVTRAADRVAVLSEDHARSVRSLRELAAKDPVRLVPVPNGVDAERFTPGEPEPGLRAALGVGDDDLLAVMVAGLDDAHRFKRVDQAIDAVAAAGAGHALLVVGDGPLRAEYERHAAAAGVADRVHFLGAVDHDRLPGVLRAADVFALATQPPESFGIVLAEAMACGLPAVTSDFPGARAVVRDGVDGEVVPIGDVPAFAAALRRMAALGRDGRRAMGATAREGAVARFAWPAVVDRLEDVYAAALARARGRGVTAG